MPALPDPIRRQVQAEVDGYLLRYGAVAATQRRLLKDILSRNAETQFGREHGFTSIRTVEDYRRRVPIRDWLGISAYVDAIVDGRPDILVAEPLVFYHRTSGTTGKPKMIPFTARCEAHSKRTHRLWIYKHLVDDPALLSGRVMAVLNAKIEGYTHRGEAYGAVSGGVYSRMPPLVRRAYAHPYDVYEIKAPEARRYTLMRLSIEHECSFVFTGNPQSYLALFAFGETHAEPIIRDIHDGTLTPPGEIAPELRAAVTKRLRRNPERARALSQARERSGRFRPIDYWPGLRAVACWVGGSMGHFAGQLRDWCGAEMRFRDVGYMASEGIFSIPLGYDSPDSILALHGIVFEFVPEQSFGRPDAPALLAHEVEAGQNYHVVITTTGGLYRYAMNDVIRVTGFHDGSPLIRFLYKGSHVKNIAGEMMSIDHVMTAMAAAGAALGVKPKHFQAVADLDARRYVLHIEPVQPLPQTLLRQFLERFERELAQINENYAMFRHDRLLQPAGLCVMRPGWLQRIEQDHLARGTRDSQFKPLVLVDSVEHPEMLDFALDAAPEQLRA